MSPLEAMHMCYRSCHWIRNTALLHTEESKVTPNPPPSPELVSLALSEHCGLVRLELCSWIGEGTLLSALLWGFGVVPHLILCTVGVLMVSKLVGHGLGQL